MTSTKNPFLTIIRLLPFLLLAAGCSQLIFTDEADEESIISENALMTKGGGSNVFYYYFDEKINLEERGELMCVRFKDNDSRKGFIDELCSSPSLISVWDPDLNKAYYRENSKNILLLQSNNGGITEEIFEGINGRDDVEYVSHVYGSQKNVSTVTDEFSVYLRSLSDYGKLEELAATYGCTVAHREWFDEKTYFVHRPKDSKYSTINLAVLFYETGKFEFTSPDFIAFNVLCSNDTYYPYQWGLKNIGQNYESVEGVDIGIERAWNITEGSSDITVAVLDNGVDIGHPDFGDNVDEGYDYILNAVGGEPAYGYEAHGTAVAGIIGAKKDNNIGITGVAPGCKIVPLRVISDIYVQYAAAVNAFNWCAQNDVDVINCSWGGGNPCALLSTAIQNATSQGRNGKGCVVVFSSGNESSASVNYPSSHPDVMSIGAIASNGLRCSFSNYGSGLGLVAPGDKITTTDRIGNNGYNTFSSSNDYSNRDYTKFFDGTSAAAPFVSGVAALVLSKYPDLPLEYVRRAIEDGCQRLSTYTFQENYEFPSRYFNNQVGHGLVQADNALLQADFQSNKWTLDNISGLDFTIINSSSYKLDNLILDVRGSVDNEDIWLVSSDILAGVESIHQTGYPIYRGESLSVSTGSYIRDITVELYASSYDYDGEFEIGVAFDTPAPNSYENFAFDYGDVYATTLPDIPAPIDSRRMIYIRIFDGNNN